jgi:hypothetical protein
VGWTAEGGRARLKPLAIIQSFSNYSKCPMIENAKCNAPFSENSPNLAW